MDEVLSMNILRGPLLKSVTERHTDNHQFVSIKRHQASEEKEKKMDGGPSRI